MITTDNYSPTIRNPIHQRPALPSNTPQFATPPYILLEKLQKLNPSSPSVQTTFVKIRDFTIPQIYPHANACDPTITPLYMQETPCQF